MHEGKFLQYIIGMQVHHKPELLGFAQHFLQTKYSQGVDAAMTKHLEITEWQRTFVQASRALQGFFPLCPFHLQAWALLLETHRHTYIMDIYKGNMLLNKLEKSLFFGSFFNVVFV